MYFDDCNESFENDLDLFGIDVDNDIYVDEHECTNDCSACRNFDCSFYDDVENQ